MSLPNTWCFLMVPISERAKLVIEAKDFALLPETEFFNIIDPLLSLR
jgi:hypothetical protein